MSSPTADSGHNLVNHCRTYLDEVTFGDASVSIYVKHIQKFVVTKALQKNQCTSLLANQAYFEAFSTLHV